MDEAQFEQISQKLDRIIMLLSLNTVRGLETDQQILTLSSAGFQPSEIARFLGKTPNAVRVALHKIRRQFTQADEASSSARDSEHGGGTA